MKLKHVAAFLLLALSWGSSYFWIKIGLREIQPLTLVSIRVFFGALGLCTLMVVTGQKFPRNRKMILKVSFLGVVSVATPFLLLTWGETRINSSLTGVLNSTVPLFTVLFAHFLLPNERLSAQSFFGLILGITGVVILTTHHESGITANNSLSDQITGALSVIFASLLYGFAAVYARKYMRGISALVQATIVMLSADFALWLLHFLALLQRPFHFPVLPLTWMALIWLGLVGSCLAYSLYFYLINEWGASRASLVMYVCPIVAVLIGVIGLNETLDGRFFLGTALVISGLIAANWRQLRSIIKI